MPRWQPCKYVKHVCLAFKGCMQCCLLLWQKHLQLFSAVFKVSFDAVTSMPSASAIETTNHKHCQQHQKLQKQHNPNDFRHWQGCSTFFCLLPWRFLLQCVGKLLHCWGLLCLGYWLCFCLVFACDFAGLELSSIWLIIIIIIMRLAALGSSGSSCGWQLLSSPSHSAALELPQWNIANPMVAHWCSRQCSSQCAWNGQIDSRVQN